MANYLRKLRARSQIAELSVGALNPQGGGQLPTESEIVEVSSGTPKYLELRIRAQIVSLSVGALDPQAGGELATEAASPRPDCSGLGGGAKSVGWGRNSYEIRKNGINYQHDCEFIGAGARSAGWWRISYGSCEPEARLLSSRWGR